VTDVKNVILPIIGAIVFFLLVRLINPEIEVAGMIIVLAAGALSGYFLSQKLFKEKTK